MSFACTRCNFANPAAFSGLDAVWMRAVGVKPDLLACETRRYSLDSRGRGGMPVRCVVAQQRIVRGERLCTVPPNLILSGLTADRLLREFAQTAAANAACAGRSSLPLRRHEEIKEGLHRMATTASPRLLASRDGLLVTAALYLCRRLQLSDAEPPSPLMAWVHAMPRRVPPLGLLLAEHLEGNAQHTPLQRRLSLGDVTVPLLPGVDVKAAATELLVAAVEKKGLAEGLRSPHTEVVLTESMLADFHAGRHIALTPRQFEAAAAHTVRHGVSASVKQLAAMEAELQRKVLVPLLCALSPVTAPGGDTALDGTGVAEELEAMRWAHFMLRSRAVNVSYRRGAAELAAIPFLDRLNHSHLGANVTYVCRESQGEAEGKEVVVTASRNIRPGEELVLHYGNIGQRGCLFGDESTRESQVTAAVAENRDPRREKMDAVTRDIRAIEARQRREMFVDEDAAAEEASPVFNIAKADAGSDSDFAARGAAGERSKAGAQAAKEATWLWRYGFLRSEKERAYEASHRWSRGLRERLAHLTDVRRKGAPGSFVVGVPEGLNHLREQRESLERERYGSAHVFPPQQT